MDINRMAQQMEAMQRQIDELRREVFCPVSDVNEIVRMYELGRIDDMNRLMRKGKKR